MWSFSLPRWTSFPVQTETLERNFRKKFLLKHRWNKFFLMATKFKKKGEKKWLPKKILLPVKFFVGHHIVCFRFAHIGKKKKWNVTRWSLCSAPKRFFVSGVKFPPLSTSSLCCFALIISLRTAIIWCSHTYWRLYILSLVNLWTYLLCIVNRDRKLNFINQSNWWRNWYK